MPDLVIVGSGPAGYTAALYAARADMRPVVIEGFAWGGLLQQTTEVENFPGFPEGILGPELMAQMRSQAERFGATFITEDAAAIQLSQHGHQISVGGEIIEARALILAMGADPRRLDIPGEDTFSARGVSYCATCDAAFFRGKRVFVVGGGDSAMEEASFLARFADQVSIVHRRQQFPASAIMYREAMNIENLDLLTPYAITALSGEQTLVEATVENTITGAEHTEAIDGLFVAIGHVPNSQLVAAQLSRDTDGYIRTRPATTHTSFPGVFAAGDISDRRYRQAITAAGSGCQAALDASEWLGLGLASPWLPLADD